MGKKRVRQKTVRYIYEGKLTEKMFFYQLHQCFPNTIAKPLDLFCGKGGTADSQVSNTLKSMHFNKISSDFPIPTAIICTGFQFL